MDWVWPVQFRTILLGLSRHVTSRHRRRCAAFETWKSRDVTRRVALVGQHGATRSSRRARHARHVVRVVTWRDEPRGISASFGGCMGLGWVDELKTVPRSTLPTPTSRCSRLFCSLRVEIVTSLAAFLSTAVVSCDLALVNSVVSFDTWLSIWPSSFHFVANWVRSASSSTWKRLHSTSRSFVWR